MICPECGSKLSVKDSREVGFSQVRQRVCQGVDCNFEMITEEKMIEYKKAVIYEISTGNKSDFS